MCPVRRQNRTLFEVPIVLHHFGLVGRQAIKDEKQRLLAIPHQLREHCHKQLGAHPAFIRGKPEGAFGVDGRGRRHRLTCARHRNDWRLPFDAPGPALHRIGTKAGFIPKIDLRPTTFGPRRNARIAIALPGLYRRRVALVSAHQRLLWRQPQNGQQLANRGQAEFYAELVSNQLGNQLACPQAKIKPILTRIPAVHPSQYLSCLFCCQFRRTARALPRTQCT